MSWVAIWDRTGPIQSRMSRGQDAMQRSPITHGTLILEGRLARGGDRPVRLWAGISDEACRFSLYWMPDGSIRIYHRDVEVFTEPGTLAPGETFQLHYRADIVGRNGLVDLRNLDRDIRLILRPGIPAAPELTDFLPSSQRFLEELSLAAIATHDVPIGPVPGFEEGTPINTPAGPVRVEDLRPGMVVDTVQSGPQVVRWTGKREVLSLGSMSPVLLRAPYFGLSQDIRVSANHRLLMDGTDVEYLFGEERIYMRAGDMINGVSVRKDHELPTRMFHHFMLDDHDCVRVGRCRLETLLLGDMLAAKGRGTAQLCDGDAEPDYPTLNRAAAQTLLSLMAEHRRVAA